MTIRDTLQSALPAMTANLVRELGVYCHVRRLDTEAPTRDDGGPADEWYRPGEASPLGEPVFIYAADESARRKFWGAEADIGMTGFAIRNPIREGDRIKPKAGEYTGQVLEVVKRLPDDISDTATLGLQLVRMPAEGGF